MERITTAPQSSEMYYIIIQQTLIYCLQYVKCYMRCCDEKDREKKLQKTQTIASKLSPSKKGQKYMDK